MSAKSRTAPINPNWALSIGLLAVVLGVLLCLYYFQWTPRRQFGLTLTAGSAAGQRHLLAELLAAQVAAESGGRVEVTLEPTAGSAEALQRVAAGELDLALLQGGLRPSRSPRVRQVTALHVEPLHLLVRAELHAAADQGLDALRGRQVNLSVAGSGTAALAADVLQFAGLRADHDFTATRLSYAELVQADAAALPDAIFMVSSLPSPVAQHLVSAHDYRLLPLPFAEAYALGGLTRDDLLGADGAAGTRRVDRIHVYDAVIPAYAYDVHPPVPGADIHTLGTRLLLVAHERVPRAAVTALLTAVYATDFAQLTNPALTAGVLSLPPEFPYHEGTRDYQRRNQPLIAGDVLESFEQTLNIMAVFFTAAFSLWIWTRQKLRLRRDANFAHYVTRVGEIERHALDLESAAQLRIGPLLRLRQDLSRLKCEALDRFARGELQRSELMSGFLAQVNDARNYLTRLILHERDNLEDTATQQGRSVQDVWNEAAGAPESTSEPPPKQG